MACKVADIQQPYLVSESKAIVTDYAYSKILELKKLDEPRIVAFIDIGHSQTTITIGRFEI